jgi:hypothetical protein
MSENHEPVESERLPESEQLSGLPSHGDVAPIEMNPTLGEHLNSALDDDADAAD